LLACFFLEFDSSGHGILYWQVSAYLLYKGVILDTF
jgi:hypothetical protein